MKTKPIGWRVARSGDFGYVYGSYDFGIRERFLHACLEIGEEAWQIVAEITNSN